MPRIFGKELFDLADKGIALPNAIYIAILAIRCLRELHNRGYIHADIKLENIKFDKATKTLAIYDFGFTERSLYINQCCGSVCFMAPETFFNKVITHASDIFSLGVVICFLCGIMDPFLQREDFLQFGDSSKMQEPIDKDIAFGQFIQDHGSDFAYNYKDSLDLLVYVLAGLTAIEPGKRMSLDRAERLLTDIYNALSRQIPTCNFEWYKVTPQPLTRSKTV